MSKTLKLSARSFLLHYLIPLFAAALALVILSGLIPSAECTDAASIACVCADSEPISQ